jgi:mRNA-degrading endonuclease RelE of RelBE toxin-antitoxin system
MTKKLLQIHFERKADKFFGKCNISKDEVSGLIVNAVRRLAGQNENVDVKYLKGQFKGYLRIRKGDLRIVIKIAEDEKLIIVTVSNIDFRGSVYK